MKNIKKINKDFIIVNKEEKKAFTIKNIKVYDEDLIAKIIDNRFNEKYKKLLYIVLNITESDDDTESDTEIVLIKIENLKKLLLTKYYKFIDVRYLKKYLKMLMLLEEKLSMHKVKGKSR